DQRPALVVRDFAGNDGALNQREIYLLPRFSLIESHGPIMRRVSGTVSGNKGIQTYADIVMPLGQSRDQVTTIAVSPRFCREGNATVQSPSCQNAVGFQIGFRNA